MSTISAVTSDLREGGGAYDDATRHELLGLVATEADRLDRLVANLLSLSRVEAGALEADRQVVALEELLQRCLDRHRGMIGDHKLSLEAPITLPLVDADWTLVDQAVTNLVANAVRHAPDGSRIWITAHQVEPDWVEVAVRDQGPGIPPACATSSSSRSAGARAPRLPGSASRSSGPSPWPTAVGSPSPRPTPPPAVARRSASPSRCTVADQRILAADDEPAILRALTVALRARGYDVIAATNGQEALERCATEEPAAVILDLGLPDLDGIDVLRRIREWTDVPVIVLTAEGSDDRKVIALDSGADDYVTKPYSTPELLARLRVALRHRQRVAGDDDDAVWIVGDLTIDVPRHRVEVAGRVVALTPKEFGFLALLARHPGRVLTHRAILHDVWGPTYERETQYLRVYASQLRKKLADDPASPRLVTEPGVGYRLVDNTTS